MTDDFVFDEKAHAYLLNGKPMLGCTSVLGIIAKPALIQWAANEAVKYVREAKIWQLVPDTPRKVMIGDQELADLLKEASTAHRRKKEDAAEKGTDLHALIEEYVRNV